MSDKKVEKRIECCAAVTLPCFDKIMHDLKLEFPILSEEMIVEGLKHKITEMTEPMASALNIHIAIKLHNDEELRHKKYAIKFMLIAELKEFPCEPW